MSANLQRPYEATEQDVANLRKVVPSAVAKIEAAERRATVERIREQLRPEFFDTITGETVQNVLDEEVGR